jgi:hypothetical protein
MKRAHARPKTKEKHRSAIKNAYARSDVKERHRKACEIAQRRPEQRRKMSQIQKRLSSDPVFVAKRTEVLKRTLARSEVKAQRSKSRIEVWARPGMAELIAERIRLSLQSPEVKVKLSKSTKGSKWINNGIQNRRLKQGMRLLSRWQYGKCREPAL